MPARRWGRTATLGIVVEMPRRKRSYLRQWRPPKSSGSASNTHAHLRQRIASCAGGKTHDGKQAHRPAEFAPARRVTLAVGRAVSTRADVRWAILRINHIGIVQENNVSQRTVLLSHAVLYQMARLASSASA